MPWSYCEDLASKWSINTAFECLCCFDFCILVGESQLGRTCTEHMEVGDLDEYRQFLSIRTKGPGKEIQIFWNDSGADSIWPQRGYNYDLRLFFIMSSVSARMCPCGIPTNKSVFLHIPKHGTPDLVL